MNGKCDIYFWRQTMIVLSLVFQTFSVGILLAYPSILNPAILSPNSTDIRATPDQASWIAATNGISGMVSFVSQTPIMQIFGRKLVHVYINSALLISWIMFVFANSVPTLFAARIMQGLSIGGIYLNNIIVSEYTDPKRRGTFTTAKKVMTAAGTLFCHAMVLFLTWRQVAAIAAVTPALAIILTMFWPESPAFLASRGRFEECKNSFRWLHGDTNDHELNVLIAAQTEKQQKKLGGPQRTRVMKVLMKFFKKDFQKSFLIIILLIIAVDVSGRYFFTAYVTQIMIEIIGDKRIAVYCSIAADCVAVIAMTMSCVLIKLFKRRTLLFTLGSLGCFLMYLISLIMFLKSKEMIDSDLAWLSALALVFQNFIVNIGLIPVSFALTGEIIPLEHRGVGSFATGVVFTAFYSLTIKLTPLMVAKSGVEGTYLIYGSVLLVSLIGLYFILPETKDKTMQEIEDEMNGIDRSYVETKPMIVNYENSTKNMLLPLAEK